MVTVDLRSLVRRLDNVCRVELEGAAGFALLRTHYNVEIEHYLLKLFSREGSDLALLAAHCGLDMGRLTGDLEKALDKLRSGNARQPGFAPDLVDLVKQAWLLGSIDLGARVIRSSHLLRAMFADPSLAQRVGELSGELRRLSAEAPGRDAAGVLATGLEATEEAALPSRSGSNAGAGEGSAGTPQAGALAQFTLDLTEEARAGRIDPVLGRDNEIRQLIDILVRRRQNNPILAGEAGVGKTAVVEGFALRIAAGEVPPALRNLALHTLDLGLLQAGASMKGEFERRLHDVIEAVKTSARPVILFIDEAHMLVGAGNMAGQGDAANLLKPALARGELRTIAATTWAEYKKYFERDAALARRFQVVKVDEPSKTTAVAMMRGLVKPLEHYHNVRILDEAVVESVRLAARFIPARQLPDKSVSLLDTACARVAVSQTTSPAQIKDCERRIDGIDTECAMLARETLAGGDHLTRRMALEAERMTLAAELKELDVRWQREKQLVSRLDQLRAQLEQPQQPAAGLAPIGKAPSPAPLMTDEVAGRQAEFAAVSAQLREVQGEEPLVFPLVDAQAIAQVVRNWTGIPTGRMQSNQIRSVLALHTAMAERVIGQDHAIEAVSQAIVTSHAGLTDPRKPLGVFLMVGPSGVGKTETAFTLADLLYGGMQSLTIINMSEYKEEHKVSLLMGSPPGYVGYGDGGILTEAVRRNPYSVVLLDEMEKAHPGVQDVFFQVFDKGQMKDGEGRDIDFRNTVFIMTSNAAANVLAKLCADPETMPTATALGQALRPELGKFFKDAFLGRVTLAPFLPLSDGTLRRIVVLQLERICLRIAESHKIVFDYTARLVEEIAGRCTETASGARNVENILSRALLPELSTLVLERLAAAEPIQRIHADIGADGAFSYQVE